MIGKTIAQYKIIEELGKGGMGKVYKAHDTQLDRFVVLKMLARDLLANEMARRRFLREARLASALDHPNICTIYEIHETAGHYYIVMQFVDGQTLKKAIALRPLATQTIISVALQVADAIATAHDKGIIHRDIKPQNIMLTPRGQAKVLDFGLAKSLDDSNPEAHLQELTEDRKTLGTPSYMSPEQARGENVDRRADIFSFGSVLYEMATGKKPFVGKSPIDTLYAVINTHPEPIEKTNPTAPRELQGILDKAMAKDPAARYQTMYEFLSALKRCAQPNSNDPAIPDGIVTPFARIERSPRQWLARFFGSSRKSKPPGPSLPSNSSHDASSTPRSSEPPPGKPVSLEDDFPLIPGQYKSLAVLPFKLLGENKDDHKRLAFLDSLLSELSHFKALTLRPASSVAEYLDADINPTKIGQDLGADAVLVGSLLESGEKIRATAQLIEVRTRTILWAGKVDSGGTNELYLLDELSRRLCAQLGGKAAPGSVEDLLRDESEEIRLDALSGLRFSHDLADMDLLVEAFGDPSHRVKAAAAAVLGQFGREATTVVLKTIENAIRADDFTRARYAAKAAGVIGSSELLPILLEALNQPDGFLAAESALALGKIRDARACPELVEALAHTDANVRFAAVQALGEIADPDPLPILEIRLREDEDEGVRAKAAWATQSIIRKLVQASASSRTLSRLSATS